MIQGSRIDYGQCKTIGKYNTINTVRSFNKYNKEGTLVFFGFVDQV